MTIREALQEWILPTHCLLAKVCDKKLKPEIHKTSQDVVDAVNFIKTSPPSKCKSSSNSL